MFYSDELFYIENAAIIEVSYTIGFKTVQFKNAQWTKKIFITRSKL